MEIRIPTFARPEGLRGSNVGHPELKLIQDHGQTAANRLATSPQDSSLVSDLVFLRIRRVGTRGLLHSRDEQLKATAAPFRGRKGCVTRPPG
jgi:hypothetical protein